MPIMNGCPWGHQDHFQGMKGQFLLNKSEEFLNSIDRCTFYSDITKAFIEKFGYELSYEENPPEGTDITTLTPKPLREFPKEEF